MLVSSEDVKNNFVIFFPFPVGRRMLKAAAARKKYSGSNCYTNTEECCTVECHWR